MKKLEGVSVIIALAAILVTCVFAVGFLMQYRLNHGLEIVGRWHVADEHGDALHENNYYYFNSDSTGTTPQGYIFTWRYDKERNIYVIDESHVATIDADWGLLTIDNSLCVRDIESLPDSEVGHYSIAIIILIAVAVVILITLVVAVVCIDWKDS